MKIQKILILHPTDFSENASLALEFAFNTLHISESQLVLLHVCEIPTFFSNPFAESAESMVQQKIIEANEKMNSYLKNIPVQEKELNSFRREIILHESVYKGIEEVALRLEPSMLLIGHGSNSNLKRKIMGSTAKKLVTNTLYPIIIVPDNIYPIE
jgi:nucleotide-binding universal stress UspA family protein